MDLCRGSQDDEAGKVSAREAKELREFAAELREIVIAWLEKTHPRLPPWKK